MRRLKRRDEPERTRALEIGDEPDISPEVAAERAEGKIFEESLRKDRVGGGYRKRIGDGK